jgi:hypothetical protein
MFLFSTGSPIHSWTSRARSWSARSTTPKATKACGIHSGVLLASDRSSMTKDRYAKCVIAIEKNVAKARPTAAEMHSSKSSSRGEAFDRSRRTRMCPPARSVRAAPNVNVTAIKYELYSHAIGISRGSQLTTVDNVRTTIPEIIRRQSRTRQRAPSHPSSLAIRSIAANAAFATFRPAERFAEVPVSKWSIAQSTQLPQRTASGGSPTWLPTVS